MAAEVEARAPKLGPKASQAFLVHLICASGLAAAIWFAHNLCSLALVAYPSQFLRLMFGMETPIVVLLYSLFRQHPDHCSFLKAVGRGILGIPAGALINALGAVVLGAPVVIQHFSNTMYWSFLMSLFTCVPAASVFGSSWRDWQRIFAHAKPVETIDYMICLPAHGAVIGAWFGAWPMPLDWERPWQEWPVCVTYGAIIGYLLGMMVSFGFVLSSRRHQQAKRD